MAIIRAILASGLPAHLKTTLMALAAYGYDGRNIRPALATVAADLGKAPRRVRADVSALVALGVLVPITDRLGGRGRACVYAIAIAALPARKPGRARPGIHSAMQSANPDAGVRVSAPAPAVENLSTALEAPAANPDAGVRVSGVNPDTGVRGSQINRSQSEDHAAPAPRALAPVSIWSLRRHVLAAVHRTIELGGVYIRPDGSVNIAEVSAEVKRIVASSLRASWDTPRELQSMIEAALETRRRLTEAAARRRSFRRMEGRALEALGAIR